MRSAPKKELKTDEEPVACDICGRTILKGERTEPFLAPGGRRRTVCELCIPRADHEGWIRESAQNDLPAARARPQQRRSFARRLRGMFDGDDPASPLQAGEAPPLVEDDPPPVREREPARTRARREARQVR